MTAVAEAPRITRERRDSKASGAGVTDIDKTLAQWEKFLGKQPGCNSGFTAAPGQAMRAINVSSTAQVPMILRELRRGDGSIRISFPPSTDPTVTEDQVKIRDFLQQHHGKELTSLKHELVTLLEGSHSFKELQANKKFNKAFDSAEKWIDANFSGVRSDNCSLTVTDVVSLKDSASERVAGAIVSLQESLSTGRGALVTVSHANTQDQSLKDAIRAKLCEVPGIEPSKVKVWIGAEASAITKQRPACEGIREISLTEFLASTEVPFEADTSPKNEDVVVGVSSAIAAGASSEEIESTTAVASEPAADQGHVDTLADLQIGAVASKVAQEAAPTLPVIEPYSEPTNAPLTTPTLSTELNVGIAVDNHRTGKPQEDRHLVRSFPALEPEQAMEYLRCGVVAIDDVTRHNNSGSTFTGVVVTKGGDLVTAHLGDSPASAIIISKDGALKEVVPLIVEHKPGKGPGTSPSGREFFDNEKHRLIVSNPGVRLGIAVTHALGDAQFGDVLSHTPELQVHEIQQRLEEGDRLFLLVTSDGAHNESTGVTHRDHAATIAARLRENTTLGTISSQIAADSAPIGDNVTVSLLEIEKGKGAIIGIFDGHGGSDTSDQAQRALGELTERFGKEERSATIEEIAKLVTLEERVKALQKRLQDAHEYSGEFSEGAKLAKREQQANEKLSAVAKLRELQAQSASETGEESERLRREIQEIYHMHSMGSYGGQRASFEENVALFESDWRGDLFDIQAQIAAYDTRTRIPAMEKIQDEISQIKNRLLPS